MPAKEKWLEAAREMKRTSRLNGSTEVLLQPIYRGVPVRLVYRDLEIDLTDVPKKIRKILRLSGVPRSLITDTYKRWGGVTPRVLYVHGKLVASRKNKNRRFIPSHVCGENGIEYHNQITSIQLLYTRGFYTPITMSGWMWVKDMNPASLRARLNYIEYLRVETMGGKAFRPVPPVGMRVFDCLGWKDLTATTKSKRKK